MHLLLYGNIFVGSIFCNIIRVAKIKYVQTCWEFVFMHLVNLQCQFFLGQTSLCLWSLGV